MRYIQCEPQYTKSSAVKASVGAIYTSVCVCSVTAARAMFATEASLNTQVIHLHHISLPCLTAYLYQLKSTKSDLASSKTQVTSWSSIKDSNTRTQVETQVCTRSYPKPGTSKLPKRSLVKGEKFNDISFATKNIVSCFPKEWR